MSLIQWNLYITKGCGTGKVSSLYLGFVIIKVLSQLYFTIDGVKKIVRYTEEFVI